MAILTGATSSKRHRWWEVLDRQVCGMCGIEKPRADEATPPCSGRVMLTPAEIDGRRGAAFLYSLLGWAWARMRKQNNDAIDPAAVRANKIGLIAQLSALGQEAYSEALAKVSEDSRAAYEAISSDTCPRVHCLAVCVVILGLIEMAVGPTEQVALTATAILAEARDQGSDWPRIREGELATMTDRILSEAARRGYFRAPAPGLGVVRIH